MVSRNPHQTWFPDLIEIVRSMILALKRFEVADPVTVRNMERGWAKQRTERGLDLYGGLEAEGS